MLKFEALLFIYVYCRGVLALPLCLWLRVVLALPLAAAAFKFHLLHLAGGPFYFAPALPGWVMDASAWCFGVVFFWFFLLLAADFVELATWLVRRVSGHWSASPDRVRRRRKISGRIKFALLLLAAGLTTAGLIGGKAEPRIAADDLAIAGLPVHLDGFKIAVLTDLHCDASTDVADVARLVERVNALNPDAVAVIGDCVDGAAAEVAPKLAPLARLRSRFGVFAVPGNHEYYSGFTDWEPVFQSLGFKLLLNDHNLLGDGKLALAGISDYAARRAGLPGPDLKSALAEIPPGVPVVLLAHRPGEAKTAAASGVALQLSGHTHGGMVWGLDLLIKMVNGGFVRGVYQVDGMTLLVANGTGIWRGFPLRCGAPAEIRLVRLHPAAAN